MEEKIIIESKFNFGNVVATTPLFEYCKARGFALFPYMVRHASCDWGDVCKEDWESNDEALKNGQRLLSEYKLPDGKKSGLSPSGTEAQLRYFFLRTTNPQYPQVLL